MLPRSMAEEFTADSIGTQVTRTLDEARVTASELLARAEQRADRAGRDELTDLRSAMEERIETLRITRERLAQSAEGTASRLRAAASQIEEQPARLAADEQAAAAESFERTLDGAEPAGDGPPAHVAALVKAAEEIAGDLAESSRRRAKEIEHAARREVDRMGLGEPTRLARASDPTARRAESLRREVEALNEMLDADVMGAHETEERTDNESAPDERRRAGRRGRRQRR